MEWLAGLGTGNATAVSIARMVLQPGMTSERHRHPNCEEAILVEQGQVVVHIDGVTSTHSAGDCVVVPPDCPHHLQNDGSTDVQLLLVYGAGQRVYERC
jgi:quercetin dioxygenase-like cupin family protein